MKSTGYLDLKVAFSALLLGASTLAISANAQAACPAVTVADPMGITGTYPQQFELAEFEQAASCDLSFSENPSIADLNGKITGNPDLPPVSDRLPDEPLIVMPYDEIGSYGGTLHGLAKATESGTSDLLSLRHVNFARYLG